MLTDAAPDLASRVTDAVAAVRRALEDYLERGARAHREQGLDLDEVWSALRGQVGGKLLRPRLLTAACLGLGGPDGPGTAQVGAAVEMLHTAMLVHDDVLDHDDVRRGRRNVSGTVRTRLLAEGRDPEAARSHANAAGLLAGDLALSAAFDLAAGAPLDPVLRARVVGQMSTAITATVAGELADVEAALAPPGEVDVIRVADLKTARYSFVLPLQLGALLAGADQHAAALAAVGRSLGVAFQLVDDDLGVFADEAVTGKSTLSDLREGKRTLLLQLAYRAADGPARAVLDELVGRPDLDRAGADRVRAVLVATGARQAALAAARYEVGAARDAWAGLPEPLVDHLAALAEDVLERAA